MLKPNFILFDFSALPRRYLYDWGYLYNYLSWMIHVLCNYSCFVQSEKSKKAGNAPPTTLLVDFLKASYQGCSDILLLEEDMNFNSRAASLSVSSAGSLQK